MAQTLWDEALASISPKLQSVLPKPIAGHNTIDRALVEVREARDKCIQQRWRINRKDGSIIIVRDLLEKVVKYFRRFKEIGDIVIQFDPVHAALPWAGVRFIFEVSMDIY